MKHTVLTLMLVALAAVAFLSFLAVPETTTGYTEKMILSKLLCVASACAFVSVYRLRANIKRNR